jgi:hypothetical protein
VRRFTRLNIYLVLWFMKDDYKEAKYFDAVLKKKIQRKAHITKT